MTDPQRPSSIPPSRAKWQWAMLGLLIAVSGLVVAVADYVRRLPTPSAPRAIEQPAAEPVADKQALPEIPKELDSSPADRYVRDKASRELGELKERVDALRATQCVVMAELRDTRIALTRLEAGKRSSEAAEAFKHDTAEWSRCPVLVTGDGKRQQLPSLREAADSALRR